MPDYLRRPEYWLARAEEARTQADQMSDERARRVLLGIAKNYEQLAEQAEAYANRRKPPIE